MGKQFDPASPSLFSFRINGKTGKLSCLMYPAGMDRDYPTIIFAHGFPGHEKNFTLAQLLRQAGFHVLIFYYSGSWGSEGTFSFAGSIDDTIHIVDFVLADENYRFDKNHIFLLGHSFGAPVIARTMEQRRFIYGAIFLMPYDLGRIYRISQTEPKVKRSFLSLLEEGAEFISNTSCRQFYEEIEGNPDYYSYFPLVKMLSEKPIFWISCKNDTSAPEWIHTNPFMELLKKYPRNKVQWHSYDTNHYFSNMQDQLAREIARFIDDAIAKGGAAWFDASTFSAKLNALISREYKTITSECAAEYFHVSEPYFCAIVKKNTGTTFGQLLVRHKMTMATQLLQDTSLPITEISDYLGYSDASYFEKVFKKHFNATPIEYRRTMPK